MQVEQWNSSSGGIYVMLTFFNMFYILPTGCAELNLLRAISQYSELPFLISDIFEVEHYIPLYIITYIIMDNLQYFNRCFFTSLVLSWSTMSYAWQQQQNQEK